MALTELSLSFERGRVSFRGLDGDMELLDYSSNRHETFSVTRQASRWDQYSASFRKSLAAYLGSVRQGAPPSVPGLAGLQELQFEAALRRSAQERRMVPVQDEFPINL